MVKPLFPHPQPPAQKLKKLRIHVVSIYFHFTEEEMKTFSRTQLQKTETDFQSKCRVERSWSGRMKSQERQSYSTKFEYSFPFEHMLNRARRPKMEKGLNVYSFGEFTLMTIQEGIAAAAFPIPPSTPSPSRWKTTHVKLT